MAVPKYRTSSSKRDKRRSHHALKAPGMSVCSNCGEVRRPHTVCASCGHYGSRIAVQPKNAATQEAFGTEG